MKKLNYNRMAVPQVPRFFDNNELNSRARLDTGTECNYKCSFCYYKDRLDIVTDFDTINRRVEHLSKLVDEIELSGGESSIHKDWFRILDICKDKFKHISTLSNGEMFCDFDFLEKSKEHGLKEILFSVHGIGGSHDSSVGIIGAFDKIKRAMLNAHKLDIIVRINCTITSNYFDPILYSEFIKQYPNIKQVNLLPVNSWEDSIKKIDYHKASKSIKIFIDLMEDSKLYINVRYMPYCFMEGYEEYVRGVYQHITDKSDWNILMMNDEDIFSLTEEPTLKQLFRKAYDIRNETYIKPKECVGCKYILKCDGIEFNNLENNKIIPSKGITIENVLKCKYQY